MSLTLHKVLWLAGTTGLLFAGSNSQQGVPQSPAFSATKTAVYFPPGTVDSFAESFFSSYLSSAGEPSLLAAAQDPRALSYRLNWVSSQRGYVLSIRISLNLDGSGEITSIEQPHTPAVPQKTQLSVSGADGNKLLQMVEKADFWAMPAMEHEDPDPRRKVYKLDATPWVFEGVRNGSYHVVDRRGPEPSPFTEMVHFLAKDLAKLDESAIPQPYRSTPIRH